MAISGVHFYTLEIGHDRKSALVAAKIEADCFAEAGAPLAHVRLVSSDGKTLEQDATLEDGQFERTIYLEIEDPHLWWTHDFGEPALYDLEVVLLDGEEVLDRRRQSVGVRTIGLDQSPDPDEPGTYFFRFVLNGVPIFARG